MNLRFLKHLIYLGIFNVTYRKERVYSLIYPIYISIANEKIQGYIKWRCSVRQATPSSFNFRAGKVTAFFPCPNKCKRKNENHELREKVNI